MPQLDLMHFFSQFFWFSLGFTFLYAYLLHNTLPVISANLKFRQKKLGILSTDINNGKDNVSALLGVYDNLILSSFQLWKSNIVIISKQGDAWGLKNVQELNNSKFNFANKEYLRAISEQDYKSLILLRFIIK